MSIGQLDSMAQSRRPYSSRIKMITPPGDHCDNTLRRNPLYRHHSGHAKCCKIDESVMITGCTSGAESCPVVRLQDQKEHQLRLQMDLWLFARFHPNVLPTKALKSSWSRCQKLQKIFCLETTIFVRKGEASSLRK